MDVIVIGGGPAGVTAALRARELGASVALVNADAWEEPARMMAVCPHGYWRKRACCAMPSSSRSMG